MNKDSVYRNYEKSAAISVRNNSINYLENDFNQKNINMFGEYYDKRIYKDAETGEIYYPYIFSKTLEHNDYGFSKKDEIELLINENIEDFE
jgi:hypothetical protein